MLAFNALSPFVPRPLSTYLYRIHIGAPISSLGQPCGWKMNSLPG